MIQAAQLSSGWYKSRGGWARFGHQVLESTRSNYTCMGCGIASDDWACSQCTQLLKDYAARNPPPPELPKVNYKRLTKGERGALKLLCDCFRVEIVESPCNTGCFGWRIETKDGATFIDQQRIWGSDRNTALSLGHKRLRSLAYKAILDERPESPYVSS